MAPGIRAVQGHIDRQIPDDPDPVPVGVVLDRLPLAEEHILLEIIEADVIHQLAAPFFHGFRPAQADILLPLHPGRVPEPELQGAVEGIVLQPLPVIGDVGLEVVAVSVEAVLLPFPLRVQGKGAVLIGAAQERKAHLIDPLVIHIGGVAAEVVLLHFLPAQITRSDQLVRIDHIGIARKGREGLIGRISVAGLAQRQDLPPGLARLHQKVYKPVCLCGKTADPVAG